MFHIFKTDKVLIAVTDNTYTHQTKAKAITKIKLVIIMRLNRQVLDLTGRQLSQFNRALIMHPDYNRYLINLQVQPTHSTLLKANKHTHRLLHKLMLRRFQRGAGTSYKRGRRHHGRARNGKSARINTALTGLFKRVNHLNRHQQGMNTYVLQPTTSQPTTHTPSRGTYRRFGPP